METKSDKLNKVILGKGESHRKARPLLTDDQNRVAQERSRKWYVDNKERRRAYNTSPERKARVNVTRRAYYASHPAEMKVRKQAEYLAHKPESNARSRRYRTKNRDKLLAYGRAYRAANKDKIKATSAQHRNAHPEKIFAQYLRERYNITLGLYEVMLANQNGVCFICKKTPEENKRRLGVDHNHACCPTPARSCGLCIRRLLCHVCNTTVGQLERLKLSGALPEILTYINGESVNGSQNGITPNLESETVCCGYVGQAA